MLILEPYKTCKVKNCPHINKFSSDMCQGKNPDRSVEFSCAYANKNHQLIDNLNCDFRSKYDMSGKMQVLVEG